MLIIVEKSKLIFILSQQQFLKLMKMEKFQRHLLLNMVNVLLSLFLLLLNMVNSTKLKNFLKINSTMNVVKMDMDQQELTN